MDKVGKVPEFVQGLRVTDAETVEIAEMVLGSINKEIVARINQHGGKSDWTFWKRREPNSRGETRNTGY